LGQNTNEIRFSLKIVIENSKQSFTYEPVKALTKKIVQTLIEREKRNLLYRILRY